MALASVTVTPAITRLQGGSTQQYTAVAAGMLALLSGADFNWTSLTGCAVQANGALKDTSGGANGYGTSGGVSDATITSGDGWIEFVASVPFADPVIAYPEFGGKAFFAGLTTKSADVKQPSDIEFGLEVGPDGVKVYEAGVLKGNFRAARNNGRYYVGIESGQVVYRADDQVIYRSDQAITYPLRFGTCFYHRGTDQIGGDPTASYTYKAYDEAGNEAGSWNTNTWTAPDVRGVYRIVIYTPEYVYGSASVEVAKTWPYEGNTNNLPIPAKFRPIHSANDFKVDERVMDDQSAFVFVPLPDGEQIRRWRLEWNNLTAEQAQVLDDFKDEHRGKGDWFYFYDKYGKGRKIAFRADSTTDKLTVVGHPFSVGSSFQVTALSGSVLPAPLLEGGTYYVVSISGNEIGISETAGGAAIDLTTNGSGKLYVVVGLNSEGGCTWDNVRIESYEDGHRALYNTSQQRRVTLIRRPA